MRNVGHPPLMFVRATQCVHVLLMSTATALPRNRCRHWLSPACRAPSALHVHVHVLFMSTATALPRNRYRHWLSPACRAPSALHVHVHVLFMSTATVLPRNRYRHWLSSAYHAPSALHFPRHPHAWCALSWCALPVPGCVRSPTAQSPHPAPAPGPGPGRAEQVVGPTIGMFPPAVYPGMRYRCATTPHQQHTL